MFPGEALAKATVAMKEHRGHFHPPRPGEEAKKVLDSFEAERVRLRDEVRALAERFLCPNSKDHLMSSALPYCRGLVDGVVRDVYVVARYVPVGADDGNAFLSFYTAMPEVPLGMAAQENLDVITTLDERTLVANRSGWEEARFSTGKQLHELSPAECTSMMTMARTLDRLNLLYPEDALIERLVQGLSAEADDPFLPAPRYFDDFVAETTEA